MRPVIRASELPEGRRIVDAIRDADHAFWAIMAQAFPEVKTGDVAPDAAMRRETENTSHVSNWLADNWPTVELSVGMRVVFPTGTDSHFSCAVIDAGETGTVIEVDPMLVKVKLDRDHDGLAEWDNCYQWSDDEVRNELPTDLLPLKRRTVRILVETDDETPPFDLIERLQDEVNALASAMREAKARPEPLFYMTVEDGQGGAVDVFVPNTHAGVSMLHRMIACSNFEGSGGAIRRLPDYVFDVGAGA